MGEQPPDDEVRLALALAAAHGSERRLLPDRRSGLDRRKERMLVSNERRAGRATPTTSTPQGRDTAPRVVCARVTVRRSKASRRGHGLAACVLVACEHEMQALDALRDAHLSGVLQAMTTLRAERFAALAAFAPDASNRGSF